jgi:RNA polymerase sigma-70 factor (ECF subfamily)
MDATRLALWVDRLGAALVLYARQWCDCPEDVVQEAFVRLVAADPDNVPAWLHRVVRHAALDAARAARRRRAHESVVARPLFVPLADDPDGEAIERAVQTLPADLREPLVAHLWGGLPFADIGVLMGTSAATAHRRYREALDLLRSHLEPP